MVSKIKDTYDIPDSYLREQYKIRRIFLGNQTFKEFSKEYKNKWTRVAIGKQWEHNFAILKNGS